MAKKESHTPDWQKCDVNELEMGVRVRTFLSLELAERHEIEFDVDDYVEIVTGKIIDLDSKRGWHGRLFGIKLDDGSIEHRYPGSIKVRKARSNLERFLRLNTDKDEAPYLGAEMHEMKKGMEAEIKRLIPDLKVPVVGYSRYSESSSHRPTIFVRMKVEGQSAIFDTFGDSLEEDIADPMRSERIERAAVINEHRRISKGIRERFDKWDQRAQKEIERQRKIAVVLQELKTLKKYEGVPEKLLRKFAEDLLDKNPTLDELIIKIGKKSEIGEARFKQHLSELRDLYKSARVFRTVDSPRGDALKRFADKLFSDPPFDQS